MPRRWYRRRGVIIGIVTVALAVGLVFATLPYLQPPGVTHASIQTAYRHDVPQGNSTYPGFYALEIPITISEPFAVGVRVGNGTASFCVLQYAPYLQWIQGSSPPLKSTFPFQDCVSQTSETSQQTLNFPVTPGTWVVVALNTSPSIVTAYFSPA